MRTMTKLLLISAILLGGLHSLAQNPNLLPTKVSNFSIGSSGNGHNSNNLSNVGVSTDYGYVVSENGLHPDDAVGKYAVGSNARYYNHFSTWLGEMGFFDMGDHTSGSGNYMIVNGSTTAGKKVWEFTVSGITPGVMYDFKAYVTCLFINLTGYEITDMYKPKLRLKINDQNVGPTYTVPWTDGGHWESWTNTWTAGTNVTSAKITIIDECTTDNGNDFGLDDISFRLASGYSVVGHTAHAYGCHDNYDPVDILANVDITQPSGQAPLPTIIRIKMSSDTEWTESPGVLNTLHGTAYIGADNMLYYTPEEGFVGNDQLQYQVEKYGLTSEAKPLFLHVLDAPSNIVVHGVPEDHWCKGDTPFQFTATYSSNGSELFDDALWQWTESLSQPEWNTLNFNDFPNSSSCHDYYVRCKLENACGSSYSEPMLLRICDEPVLNKTTITDPPVLCGQAALPNDYLGQIYVNNWKNDVGTEGWIVSHNNGSSWVPLTETTLQNGDKLKYKASNCCGDVFSSNSVTVSVSNGPAFTQNTPAFEPYYCVGESLSFPTPPNFNNNGLAIDQNYWAYSSDGGMTFNRINGTPTLTTEWNGYQICYQLMFQCGSDVGYVNSPQPFVLNVYGDPEFTESLLEFEQPFCADDVLAASMLQVPACTGSPDLTTEWQISSGTAQSGFTTLSLPRTLSRNDNGKWIRRYATSDCGSQHSNAVQLVVNDKPALNSETIDASQTICAGATLPANFFNQISVVDWNGSEGVFAWWIKHPGGDWDTLTMQTIPQNGDLVQFVASNDCGSTSTYTVALNVTDGPLVAYTPTLNPFYCVGDMLNFPAPPEYDPNGLTVLPGSSFWAYSDDGVNYYSINQTPVLTEEWNGRLICYMLAYQCAGEVVYAYSPQPVTLTVYGLPAFISPDPCPSFLDAVCPGTLLSEIVPEGFAPEEGSYYEDFGWEISDSPTSSSFTRVDDPTTFALAASHNGCVIRFYVEGCGDPVNGQTIQLAVGDAPSLNVTELVLPMDVCEGTSVASLVNAGLLTDVHVEYWNLFDNPEDPVAPSEERWEVFYNGQWQPLTNFDLDYNNCAIRYYACNRCGCTELVSSNPVSVVVGPSFSTSAPLSFEDSYCVGEHLVFPSHPAFEDPYDNVTDDFWAYSYDGMEYYRITETDPELTETWHGRYITYILDSNCGGENRYPNPFQLHVIGTPEILSASVEPDTLCEGALLSNMEVTVNWHHGSDNGSTWQYASLSDPYNLFDFDPEVDALPAGANYLFYYADNGCYSDNLDNPLTVFVKAHPHFADNEPIALPGFCEGEVITLPDPPAVIGDIEEAGVWQISVTNQQYGEYVDYSGSPLSMSDEGRWIKYTVYGCDSVPVSKYGEVHVMKLPEVEFAITDNICKGQMLNPEVASTPVEVEYVLWKYRDSQGNEFFFDPTSDPFNILGDYYVLYAPVNRCNEDNPQYSAPHHISVVQGPEYAPVSWPDPIVVCMGQTLSEVLSEYGISEPALVNPGYQPAPQSLGWFVRYTDVNDMVQYTACSLDQTITERYSGCQLCYGMQGDCSTTPIYSNGVVFQVRGIPEIVYFSMSPNFCDGDVFPSESLAVEIEPHNSSYITTWEWNDGTTWSAMPDVPFVVGNQHDGMLVRYCLASDVCDFPPDVSSPMMLYVSSVPEINEDIDELLSVCEDGALTISAPEVTWHHTYPEQGVWQVSPTENGNFSIGPFGDDELMFDMNHVAYDFDGWYLRYHVEGCNGENNSNTAKIKVFETQNIQLSGNAEVAVMNSFWPGVYYYYTEVIGGGLNWSLTPPIWPIQDTIIDGKSCCMIRVTCRGRATLTAFVGDGSCGSDQFVINASSFGVDENEALKLEVYPNPARQRVNVVSEEIEAVVVYDLLGQRLKVMAGNGDTTVSFNVDDLSEALYIVEVKTRKGIVRKPFSVSR